MRRYLALALIVVAAGLALGACASTAKHGHSASSGAPGETTLDIYSSLPLTGIDAADGNATANGIRLALQQVHSRVGRYRIHFLSLNDSGRDGPWSARDTIADASRAAKDPRATFYVGELNRQASAISARILTQADVAQLSPTEGPSHQTVSSFLSLAPSAAVEAQAAVDALGRVGCTRVALGSLVNTGTNLQGKIKTLAATQGITVVDSSTVEGTPSSLTGYAFDLHDRGINCFMYDGHSLTTAVALAKAVHLLVPKATLLATDAVCTETWAQLPGNSYCTSPVLPVSRYPGVATFVSNYKNAFGVSPPNAYALYGYEAAELFLRALGRLGAGGDHRARMLTALVRSHTTKSLLGSYSFDKAGNSTIRQYGLYTAGPDGLLRFFSRLLDSNG